jgi:hypothetical protein
MCCVYPNLTYSILAFSSKVQTLKDHYIQVNTVFSTGVQNTLLELNVAVTMLGEYFSNIQYWEII